MESHLEARLWNDAFVLAQETVGVARGTIKATVLIETILGAGRRGALQLERARGEIDGHLGEAPSRA